MSGPPVVSGASVAAVAAHVVVPSLTGEQIALDSDDAHHLASVLRLRPGEPVGATDGRGNYVPCRYAGKGVLEAEGPVTISAPRRPALTVAFAPVKGDRPEWAVQKLAELGVDRIVVLEADRAVVRWSGERAVSHLARLQKVARAAVMQSRQVWMPAVEGPAPVLSLLGSAGGAVALAQMGGPAPSTTLHTVLIGPEGGWSPAELEAAGPSVVGLGPSVLRAETAAVAAGVLLAALRAGVVASAGAHQAR